MFLKDLQIQADQTLSMLRNQNTHLNFRLPTNDASPVVAHCLSESSNDEAPPKFIETHSTGLGPYP